MSWRRFVLTIGLTCIVSGFAAPAPALAAEEGGFRALSGVDAAGFGLPEDVELVRSFRLEAYGLAYERYQQTFGNARVLGGQLTLYRDDAGDVTMVIGAHHPDIAPGNSVRLFADDVLGIVERDIGRGGERKVELMIDPLTGQYFYWVETRRIASRWVHWVGAETGRVVNKFDALAHLDDCTAAVAPCGFGVEFDDGDPNDVKDLTGLTTFNGSVHTLVSDDSPDPARQETHDQGSTNRPFLGPIATDADDLWTEPGDVSPAQPALVDAHYYARVADDYFLTRHGFDWVQAFNDVNLNDSPNKRIQIQAHFFKNYNNAFWNGSYAAFGDGDGKSFREFTSLDVVGHELTHGTTEFTSDLVYQDESGALNESFSDIMGNSMEFYADSAGLETANVSPDWLVAEDFDLRGDTVAGFRNMADPEEDGDPDDYSERQIGGGDNGGVHTNSGIPNHAYYLLVNGGLNASCAAPATHNSAHCTGGVGDGTAVTGVGLADAESIFFLGFIGLQSNATMCDARDATVLVASQAPFVGTEDQSTSDAWEAVGVVSGGCGSGGGDTGGGGTGSIRGGVTGNGSKLADALVSVDGTGLTDLTNRGGKYKIEAVPAGTYSVTASADGCGPETVDNVTVQDGVTLTVDFALTCP